MSLTAAEQEWRDLGRILRTQNSDLYRAYVVILRQLVARIEEQAALDAVRESQVQ